MKEFAKLSGSSQTPKAHLARLVELGVISATDSEHLARMMGILQSTAGTFDIAQLARLRHTIKTTPAPSLVAVAIAGVISDSAKAHNTPLAFSVAGADAIGALIGGVGGAVAGSMVGGEFGRMRWCVRRRLHWRQGFSGGGAGASCLNRRPFVHRGQQAESDNHLLYILQLHRERALVLLVAKEPFSGLLFAPTTDCKRISGMKVCPSAQPTDDGSVVIGIVGRQDAARSGVKPIQTGAASVGRLFDSRFNSSHGGAAFCGTLRGTTLRSFQ